MPMNPSSQPTEAEPVALLRSPEAVADVVSELVPIYQAAFAGEPWYEVSQCRAPTEFPDPCPSRRSSQGIGETCARCGEVLSAPAFSVGYLADRWATLFDDQDARLYLERLPDGSCVLAAVAWLATPAALAERAYSLPEEEPMRSWLAAHLPLNFVWLEDIFANREVRPAGNLWNYRSMVGQLVAEFDHSVLGFRTFTEPLIAKTLGTFGDRARRFARFHDVPDRRDVLLVTVTR